MKIYYSKQALKKFKFLKKIGWKLSKLDVRKALLDYDYYSEDAIRQVEIVLKEIDERHNLRVIYTKSDDIITVVTFYPTKKGRYIK